VRVYGEEELSTTFRVASDGSIDYPLLGTIKVSGMTPSHVVNTFESMLRDGKYLKNPQVSIFVKEYNSKKISVFGQVKKPGTFPYQDGMSVVEGISIAGGQGHLKGKIIRIAHMGCVDEYDILTGISCLEKVLHELGYEFTFGVGLSAAQEVFNM